jgi:hypothetical protein
MIIHHGRHDAHQEQLLILPGRCSIVIRWKDPNPNKTSNSSRDPTPGVLNLAEVRVKDKTGSFIPSSNLTFVLSSTLTFKGTVYPADNCNNGNTSGLLPDWCSTGIDPIPDPNPSLTISFACSTGSILSTITAVEVWNVDVNSRHVSCCLERITKLKVDFLNTDLSVAFSFPIDDIKQKYDITLPSGK